MSDRETQLEQLTAYLDGELAGDERGAVEALLERDAEARALLDDLRRTSRLIGSLPHATAPSDMAASVQARMERRELLGVDDTPGSPGSNRTVRWVNRFAVAATIGLVCTAGWLGYQGMSIDGAFPHLAARPEDVRVGATGTAKPSNGELVRRDGRSLGEDPPSPGPERLAVARGSGLRRFKDEEPATLDAPAAPTAPVRPTETPVDDAREQDAFAVPAAAPAIETAVVEREMPAEREPVVAVRASPPADSFEHRLQNRGLSNDAVVETRFWTVSNQLEVVADEATCRKLAGELAHFASVNRVPDIRTRRLREPIDPRQVFFMAGEPDTNFASTGDQNEMRYLVNLPRKQIAVLLSQMNTAALESNDAGLRVVANGQRVDDIAAAEDFVTQAPVGGQGRRGVAFAGLKQVEKRANDAEDDRVAMGRFLRDRPTQDGPTRSPDAKDRLEGKTETDSEERKVERGFAGSRAADAKRTETKRPARAKKQADDINRDAPASKPASRQMGETGQDPANDDAKTPERSDGQDAAPRRQAGRGGRGGVPSAGQARRPLVRQRLRPEEAGGGGFKARRSIAAGDKEDETAESDFVVLAISLKASPDRAVTNKANVGRTASPAKPSPTGGKRPATRPVTTRDATRGG